MNTVPDEIRKHRLSIADFHRMGEAGVFKENERVELIEGEIYDMPPIGPPHASIVNHLTEQFVLACHKQAIVQVQNPIRLGDQSEPQPDISLLRRQEDFYERAPKQEDVLLVVEVADSSLRHDRDLKLGLYARYAIAEVWLIDVQSRRMSCYSQPGPDGYGNEIVHISLKEFGPLLIPGVAIDLSSVFSAAPS